LGFAQFTDSTCDRKFIPEKGILLKKWADFLKQRTTLSIEFFQLCYFFKASRRFNKISFLFVLLAII